MTLTSSDLDRYELLASRATEGPWLRGEEHETMIGSYSKWDFDRISSNVDFALEARTAVPLLVSACRELMQENKALKDILSACGITIIPIQEETP